MHPVISQAVGAERSRDRQAYAASCRRVAEAGRARQVAEARRARQVAEAGRVRQVAEAGRVRQVAEARRVRQDRRRFSFIRVRGAAPSPRTLRVLRPLRAPRAA